MGCLTRVLSYRHGRNHLSGKGDLSFNTINLVKLGITYGVVNGMDRPDEEGCTPHLQPCLDIALKSLLHRFTMQKRQPPQPHIS
uniref:hypothetical protein n=1 Tax=Paenibacillus sp. IHBB 10380 TaxID=1566358 RepID=UPI000A825383|nr:hypothetical protein [Paenibacillus sp. IHBB 10380]